MRWSINLSKFYIGECTFQFPMYSRGSEIINIVRKIRSLYSLIAWQYVSERRSVTISQYKLQQKVFKFEQCLRIIAKILSGFQANEPVGNAPARFCLWNSKLHPQVHGHFQSKAYVRNSQPDVENSTQSDHRAVCLLGTDQSVPPNINKKNSPQNCQNSCEQLLDTYSQRLCRNFKRLRLLCSAGCVSRHQKNL